MKQLGNGILRLLILSSPIIFILSCGDQTKERNGGTVDDPPLGRVCTLVGCSDSYSVRIRKNGAPPETLVAAPSQMDPGIYRIWYRRNDGAVKLCSVGIASDRSSATAGDCEGVSAIPDLQGGIFVEMYYLGTSTTHFEVFVVKDEIVIGQGDFIPDYQPVYPNGEECGGACSQASDAIELN